MPQRPSAQFHFKTAYAKLKTIVAYFEDTEEEFDIDVAIAKFEEGLKLAQQIRSALESAENRVKKIKLAYDE
jgi:exodeoxyribonuclease VII small subunit